MQFINKIYSYLSSIPFDTLVCIIWGSFAAVFILAFIMCLALPKVRAASKRPYLCLANAYAAVTLSAFLIKNGLPKSVLAAAMFWLAGYLSYGILCAMTKPVAVHGKDSPVALTSTFVQTPPPPVHINMPPAKTDVRLDHAISVTDRLLQKNPGKGDRQELEKLKGTLSVLQSKGTLSPSECDILNENFNALLKLMAKYNI